MQFTSALLVAGAAVASAAAIPRDVTPAPPSNYNVTAFYFSGVPHSAVTHYGLNVTDANGSTSEVTCSTSSPTGPNISPFNLTACQDPTWSFAFQPTNTSQGAGYSLKVTHLVEGASTNQTACQFVPDSDIEYVQNPEAPTGNYYRVNKGPEFQMAYGEMDECVYA